MFAPVPFGFGVFRFFDLSAYSPLHLFSLEFKLYSEFSCNGSLRISKMQLLRRINPSLLPLPNLIFGVVRSCSTRIISLFSFDNQPMVSRSIACSMGCWMFLKRT